MLEAVRDDLQFTERPVGLAAVELTGSPYEADLVAVARQHDAILLSAVGGPQRPGKIWDSQPEAVVFMPGVLRREGVHPRSGALGAG